MKKIRHFKIDHFYTEDQGHAFRAKLERLGMSAMGKAWEHPGGAVCKFLVPTNAGYLEFVSYKKAKKTYGGTGISLAVDGKLEPHFKRMPKSLKPKFYHRNYDWQADNKAHLPGWNFLSFKTTPRAVNTWFTEYEFRTGKKKKARKYGKLGAVVALQVGVGKKDEAFFKKLLGLKKLESLEMGCGRILHMEKAKRTHFHAVVISVPKLDRMQGKGLLLDVWGDKPALRAVNPNPRGWDVLFVQE